MVDTTGTNSTPHTLGANSDFEAAVDQLMSLADFERSIHSPGHSGFHLERMVLLMDRLGNPQNDIPTVHVAGTKGKGSTAAMVASMLAAEDYVVGLYTSPHLHSVVERIKVGRLQGSNATLDSIGRDEFAAVVGEIWPVVKEVGESGGYGGVTFFEAMTAMAFVYFRQVGADFQVLEVGLGGRLDSTNIVTPVVSVITSISLDHVATLGDTVSKIAYEKAGIIKPGTPVVVAPQGEDAMRVFRSVAEERRAELVDVEARVSWSRSHADLESQSFELKGLDRSYGLTIPLIGSYQMENAGTAVAAIETLIGQGFIVSGESIVKGMRDVRWSARLEILSKDGPIVVVDGAHNPYSMKQLVRAVRELFEFDDIVMVFGSLGGHSARGMLAELAQLDPLVIAVRSRHPRSAHSGVVAKAASEHGMTVALSTEKVSEGIRKALEMAGERTLVLGTGSLSVAAEIIEEIKGISPELYPNIKPPPSPVDIRNI